MKIYSKIQLLKKIGISYQTLLRYEKMGIVNRPKNTIGRARAYSEREYNAIINKIKDMTNNPEKYISLNIKIKRSRGYQDSK